MTVPVCESKWQCQLNGLFNTAAIVTTIALLWGVVESLRVSISSEAWGTFAVLMALPMASVLYAGVVRLRHALPGWVGLAFVFAGMAWAIFVMNNLVRL